MWRTASVNLDHTLQDICQILENILSHVNFHIFSAKENFFYNHYALDARYDLELELDAYSAQLLRLYSKHFNNNAR